MVWIETWFGFRICIIFCKVVFDLDLNLKNLNHFTGIWKRLKFTVWVPLPWSLYANTKLNHDKVSVYCALLTPKWRQSLRSPSMQVGETWCLKYSRARLEWQNRKFPPILTITEAKIPHFFVCKRTGFVHQELGDFVKITLTRVIDCDSSRVILWKTWLVSGHHFSQRGSRRVRVTKNLLLSHWLESRYHWPAQREIEVQINTSCKKRNIVFIFFKSVQLQLVQSKDIHIFRHWVFSFDLSYSRSGSCQSVVLASYCICLMFSDLFKSVLFNRGSAEP